MSAHDPGSGARLGRAIAESARTLGIPVSHDQGVLGSLEPLRGVPPVPAPAFDAVAAVLSFLVVIDEAAAAEDVPDETAAD